MCGFHEHLYRSFCYAHKQCNAPTVFQLKKINKNVVSYFQIAMAHWAKRKDSVRHMFQVLQLQTKSQMSKYIQHQCNSYQNNNCVDEACLFDQHQMLNFELVMHFIYQQLNKVVWSKAWTGLVMGERNIIFRYLTPVKPQVLILRSCFVIRQKTTRSTKVSVPSDLECGNRW